MLHYLYFLQSKDRKHFYIGSTASPKERLRKHNQGASKSTRPFRPWNIIYTEEHNNKSDAVKREYHLKSPKGYKEKRVIIDKYKK